MYDHPLKRASTNHVKSPNLTDTSAISRQPPSPPLHSELNNILINNNLTLYLLLGTPIALTYNQTSQRPRWSRSKSVGGPIESVKKSQTSALSFLWNILPNNSLFGKPNGKNFGNRQRPTDGKSPQ